MKFILTIIVSLLCSACAAQAPIDSLAAKLSSDPLWMNGGSPLIKLPETAENSEVIAECFKMTDFDHGHVNKFKILEIKKIKIRGALPDEYLAALVDSDLGKKIVLFRYTGSITGWWTRVYDQK